MTRSPALPALVVLLLAFAFALAGCGLGGDDDSATGGQQADLLLDFQPNAVHAGIYLALQRDYDEGEGVDLRVQAPGDSTDALKLLQGGRTDLAILDIHDLGLAREKGADIVGVMAIVQRPLAAVLAQRSVRRPRDLEGSRVGVSGLPSDVAVLDSIVRGDGGDPDRVRKTTIGFQAVKALLARRVDAATAFWSAEGVELGDKVRTFKVDDFGAPPYPELVLAVTRRTLTERPGMIRGVVRTLQRGYTQTQLEPDTAVAAMTAAVPDLDAAALTKQLDAVGPAFSEGAPRIGALNPATLRAWGRWDVKFGILKRAPEIGAAFDTSFAGP